MNEQQFELMHEEILDGGVSRLKIFKRDGLFYASIIGGRNVQFGPSDDIDELTENIHAALREPA